MGFFRSKSHGKVYHTDSKNGEITSPIGTKILHNTEQENTVRLLSRIRGRNKNIRENHQEKIAQENMMREQFKKSADKRRKQTLMILDEIQTRQQLLRQAKDDPKILDRLVEESPHGGILPKNFKADQIKKQKEFLAEETKKVNLIKENAEGDIKRASATIKENDIKITSMKRNIAELKEHTSNIPEINQENTRNINQLTKQVAELENLNDAFENDISLATETIRKSESDLGRIRFVDKDSLFGTATNLPETAMPNDSGAKDSYKDRQDSNERAKKSYLAKKYGIGLSKAFPFGFQSKRKIKDPFTGKEKLTSKLATNDRFTGKFDKDGEPVFVQTEEKKERVEPTENLSRNKGKEKEIHEYLIEQGYDPNSIEYSELGNDLSTVMSNSEDLKTLRGQQLRAIPGLVKERENV